MNDLFGNKPLPAPLAERLRPDSLESFFGQRDILAKGKPLEVLIEKGKAPSIIFWGPPGSGKTTLARIIARKSQVKFATISAVESGVKELREICKSARDLWNMNSQKTTLFIDEVHRFGKVQQDSILPHIESGLISIIGSTTENPGLEVIPALRSRCMIFRLSALSRNDLENIVRAGAKRLAGENYSAVISAEQIEKIIDHSGGDARKALNLLEATLDATAEGAAVAMETIKELCRDNTILYDKSGNEHYDHASAYQKSMRGSDPDGALYWLAKMICGGEDPRFITRRLIVTASEDVGLADPSALLVAIAAAEAVERIGLPEGRIPLAHATLHVALAPKSNSAYKGIKSAMQAVHSGDNFPVPPFLKDTSYGSAKSFGFGEGYKYPHANEKGYVDCSYLPTELAGKKFYEPTQRGREESMYNNFLQITGQDKNRKP